MSQNSKAEDSIMGLSRLKVEESLATFVVKICTLKCLSIGTPKAINFRFVSNENFMFFQVSQYSSTL